MFSVLLSAAADDDDDAHYLAQIMPDAADYEQCLCVHVFEYVL